MAAFASFLSKALTIVISFVSVPLTVHYLGAERYGVWLTMSSLLTWMALTDFGLAGNALVNVIAGASGKDDRRAAREYSASAFWALILISVALSIVFIVGFHSVNWRAVFRVPASMSTHELHQACALTLLVFVISLPLNMLNSVYSAYQDGFVSSVWGIAGNVVALVSLVIVTQFHGGLPLLVIALSGTRMVVGMASGWYAFHSRYPWLAPAPAAIRWSCIRRLLSLGGKYMISQLASLGIYQSQPMIITQLLGPAQVTIFVVAYKIIALPVDLAYMGTVPFVSAFAEAKARGDWKWIRGAYWNSTLASILIGIPVVVSIALVAKPLIRIWAGPAATPGSALILWLSIYTVISVALMSAGAMLSGLESIGKLALSLTLCAVGIIACGIPFARWWGVSGIAFAMAINKVVTFWPILAYEIHRLLRASTSSHIESANQPATCTEGEFMRAEA